MWQIYFTNQAKKDAKKLASAGLEAKTKALLDVIEINPYQNPPPDETLAGDLDGAYCRRINIQHRLVYQILESEKAIKVLRLWTHFD